MFNFSFDKRTIYIIVAVMLGIAILKFAGNPGELEGLLLSAPGVLIAITFHEFAHGFVAYKLGDNTARDQGRLSLNPFAHLDPIGTVLLLVAGFGWGKPVQVNPRNYTRKMSMEKGEAIVSIAGPIMNFILAIIFAIITCIVCKNTGTNVFISREYGLLFVNATGTLLVVLKMLTLAILINVGLGVFNLIPLPPLDGSKVILPFLPYNAKQFFINNQQMFYMLFIIIWISDIASMLIGPLRYGISSGLLDFGKMILGF